MRALIVDCDADFGIVPVLENSGVTCDHFDLNEDGLAVAERREYDIIVISPELLQEIVHQAREHTTPEMSIGKLRIDTKKRTVMVSDKLVNLSRKQYSLVEVLAMNAGTVMPIKAILDHLYPENKYPGSRVIDVFLFHLRQKLSEATGGENYIKTIRGHGYMMIDRSNEDTGEET